MNVFNEKLFINSQGVETLLDRLTHFLSDSNKNGLRKYIPFHLLLW